MNRASRSFASLEIQVYDLDAVPEHQVQPVFPEGTWLLRR